MPTETQGFKYSVPVGAVIAGLVMNALYTWYPQRCWHQAEQLEHKKFCDDRFRMKKAAYVFAFAALAFTWLEFRAHPGSRSPIAGALITAFFVVLWLCLASASWRSAVEFRGNEFVRREGRDVKVINLSDITDVRLERGGILVDYGASTPLRVSVFHDRLTTLIAMLRYHRPEKSTTSA